MTRMEKIRQRYEASVRRENTRIARLAKKYGTPVSCANWNLGTLYRDEKGRLVYLTGGSYMGAYGVSNHWTWRIVNKDGTLGNIGTGYGGVFFTAPDYRVEIRIRKVKEG